MSTSIDEKVVAMKLNNSQFQANAKQTLGTLSQLSQALKMGNAAKGLTAVSDAAKNTNFAGLANSVDGLASKFSALSVIGVTALATIANKAVTAGLQIAKSLTIDPIKSGFDEYELKMGSIQTILANTARFGTKLPEVVKNLDELNHYADKTIYNFGDMTKNIGLFTNAGIKIKDATKMIQGFSNEAAASGTSSQGAASAAYQLSQALSAGKITLMDWRSLQNVGMGNKNMQNSLIQIADATGTLNKKNISAKTIQENFNGSLEKGWLTADVMSKYLKIMATDNEKLNRKQLANIGITGKQADAFIRQQKMASEAATKVRTLSQLTGTIRESIGSSWAETFDIIVGDFNEATKLFTGVNNTLGKMLGDFGTRRNEMLKEWDKFGGRKALIDGVANAFRALMSILTPIKDAFREVFPATTGKQLAEMTKNFRDFTAGLKLGEENMDRLKRTFAGIFSVFKIGWTIIKGVISGFMSLFGLAQGGSGGFLALTASVGDFLVKIQEWLVKGEKIQEFFDRINAAREAVLGPLIDVISKVGEAFGALLSGDTAGFFAKIREAMGGLPAIVDGVADRFAYMVDKVRQWIDVASEFAQNIGGKALAPFVAFADQISAALGKVKDVLSGISFDFNIGGGASGAAGALSEISNVGERARSVWDGVKEAFTKVQEAIGPITSSIGNLFRTITDKVTEFIKGLDFQDAVALLNTAFFIMMYRAIKGFMDQLSDVAASFGRIADSIGETFGALTESLETMQQGVKATIILNIAIAVGILAASLYVLSGIDPAKLGAALGAVAALLIMITIAMKALLSTVEVVDEEAPHKVGSILAVGGSLLLLAGAILLLSTAVSKLAKLSWEEMTRGLIATGALLAGLALFTKFAETGEQSIKGTASLIVLAGAVYLLSIAVAKLGEMDREQLIQGGVALAAIITMLTASSVLISKFGGTGAAAILAMAAALAILVPVIALLGLLPYETLGKGLGTIGIALGMLALASAKMGDPKSIAGAVAILALAGAMAVFVPVIAAFGNMDYETLAKGLGTIGIALGLLALASQKMGDPRSIAGAAGILALAGAMAVMAPVILLLGNAPLEVLAAGLIAFAVGLGILLVAGALADKVAPGLGVLALTVIALGAGLALAGLGFLAFATGLAALAAIGAAGFAVLIGGIMGFLNLLPLIAQQVGLALRAFAVVIADSGPQILDAITTVLIAFLAAIERATPQFMRTMEVLIVGLIQTVQRMIPRLAASGAQMILKLLHIIGTYVGPMADAATRLMVNFIRAIGRNVPKLVDAGAKAIIDFLNGIAAAIRGNTKALQDAGINIADAIVDGMVSGIGRGVSAVTNAARNLAKNALDAAKDFLGIRSPSREFAKLGKYSAEGFAKGLDGNKAQIYNAITVMSNLLKDAMANAKDDIKKAEARLKKLNAAKKKDKDAIKKTKADLAQAKAELKKSSAAYKQMRTYGDERAKLGKLATAYDVYTKKIEAANKALADATKTRDDFKTSIQDQYDNLPDFTEETKLSDYTASLEKQITDTQLFAAQLQKLRSMGLNDEMYKQLLAKGTSAMPFAQQLLEGGKTAIDQVNTLGSTLAKTAKDLASTASTALYQAAVDSAAGLVAGLKKQQGAIEAQMDKIASAMVKAIKKKLGIKSPSREFMKVGGFSVQGLAKGLKSASSVSEQAASQVGADTIDALRKTITDLSGVVASEIDIDPTIRPILDLSGIKRDAGQIGSLLSPSDLSVSQALASAKQASYDFSNNRSARDELVAAGGSQVSYTQNNYSPKALSDATIYRQTKNQISTMKGALQT